MEIIRYLLLVFSIWINLSLQVPPFIDKQPVVWNVDEYAPDDTQVGCVECLHTLAITVNFVSVTVTQGPVQWCTNCFFLRRIHPTSHFCLFYKKDTFPATPETLDYAKARKYIIRVECSDGAEMSQADLDIRIVANFIPVITSPLSMTCGVPIDAAAIGANQYVFTGITATDADGDVLTYTMTSDPVNDVFDIEASTGKIQTLLPVSRFCYHTVIFYVTVTDNKSTPVGPSVVTCSIANYHDSPQVSNANIDFNIDEDLTIGNTIYTFLTPASPLTLVYSVKTVLPLSAIPLFSFTGNALTVAAKLNFEDFVNKDPNVTLTVNNGMCPPIDYYLHLHILDKNDDPVATPTSLSHTAPEGTVISMNLDTALTIADEDFTDTTFDYTIVAGNPSSYWTINAAHDLISTVTFDREVHGAGTTLTIQVADKKGPAFDTITVLLDITDVNDNAPIFTQPTFSFAVTECTTAGSVLGSLAATDADSNLNSNNVIVFDTVSMNHIAVNGAGQVSLLSNVSVGMTPSVLVGARDLGTPARVSPWQTTVSLTVSPCPPPVTTTTTAAPVCTDNGGSDVASSFWAHFASFLTLFHHGH